MLPRFLPAARLVLPALVLAVCPTLAGASDDVRQLVVSATFEAASSIRLSSQLLVFEVGNDDAVAEASVDYVASARTRPGGEVVLLVETTGNVDGPGGAADLETALTIGEGAALVAVNTPRVAERWTGGGTRAGRLVFRLRAAAAGRYIVPLRIALTTP